MMQNRKALTWATLSLVIHLESALGVEFEPQNKALVALLGTTKVVKKTVAIEKTNVTIFYSKDSKGKPSKVAVIAGGVYEPNCTHTWAIGLDPNSSKVGEIRVIEMSCPHAFPTRAASYLAQYKGKGPADLATLDGKITTIAKATGSSKLTTTAVQRSIKAWTSIKGKL